MRLKLFIFIAAILLLPVTFFGVKTVAHPGNVTSDGAHYCRTNCESYGYSYGERICHYPSMGCGQENIRQDSYESAPAIPSVGSQGNTNGTAQAQDKNLNYIKSNAETQGRLDGTANGMAVSSASQTSHSSTFCAQPVKFDSPQSKEYVDAFQASYSSACTPIYDSAYKTAYDTAYSAAANTKKAANNYNSNNQNNTDYSGWAIVGSLAGLFGLYLLVVNKEQIREWIGIESKRM